MTGYMNFDSVKAEYIAGKYRVTAQIVSQSFTEMQGMYLSVEQAFYSVRNELSDKIKELSQRIASAQQLKAYFQSKVADGQSKEGNNQAQNAICAIQRCLQELIALQQKLTAEYGNVRSGYTAKSGIATRLNSDASAFCRAISETLSSAGEVLGYGVENRNGGSVTHSAFVIDTAGHSAGANTANNGISSGVTEDYRAEDTVTGTDSAAEDRTVIITEKDSEEFLAVLSGHDGETVKFPQYNLGALGGRAFLRKVGDMSYFAVRKDGSLIGSDGYITLEKKV